MWHDLSLIAPHLIVLTVGLIALLTSAFAPRDSAKGWVGYLTTIGFIFAFVAALALYAQDPGELAFETPAFAFALSLDAFSLGLSAVILLGAIFMSLAAADYLPQHKSDHGEFYALIALSSLGMMMLVSANDLLTFFVSLELMSLAAYVLAGFKRSSVRSTESAMKYFVFGSFAAGLLLMGMAFLYGATGETNLPAIAQALQDHALNATPELVRFAMILILGAFFFKVAAVPFHMWTPDVYEGAPAAAAGFLAVAIKTAAFGGFARLILTTFGAPELQSGPVGWENLIAIAAVASMFVGNLGALGQKNLQRMLAYSAIAHTGYILVAFLVFPKDGGVAAGIFGGGLVFYLLAYTLANSAAFGVAAAIGGGDREDINEASYAGLAKKSPGHALVLTIAMLSLLGIPLTAGFMGKFILFEEVLSSRMDFLWLIIIAIVNSIMSAWFYLRVILVTYMRDEDAEHPIQLVKSRPLALSLGLAAILILLVGILPGKVLTIARSGGESLATHTTAAPTTSDAAQLRD